MRTRSKPKSLIRRAGCNKCAPNLCTSSLLLLISVAFKSIQINETIGVATIDAIEATKSTEATTIDAIEATKSTEATTIDTIEAIGAIGTIDATTAIRAHEEVWTTPAPLQSICSLSNSLNPSFTQIVSAQCKSFVLCLGSSMCFSPSCA